VGGIVVVTGFLASALFYIAVKTFYFKSMENVIEVLAVIASVLITALIGFIDDILGWKIGLRQYQKPVLCLAAAIPLMVINAGQSILWLPILGRINLGLIYPLLLIPIAVTGASNGFNMLAGYNGLESSMGIIILTTLGLKIWPSHPYIALLAFSASAALLAFLYYNKFPAKIFPGNTLAYPIGALMAAVAILGNMERAALILFIPYFIELFLKARGKMQKESFAIPKKDGSVDIKKIYGLEHVAIVALKKIKPSRKVYETDVVFSILLVEFIIAIIVFFI
jgi:UDP-N-acetylglucosamine--dolichyl-phosphate N-acetylglucosaminephosphotransferase